MYLATVGAMLGFIQTLDHPEMVGVNPEVAHEHMAGLNFLHAVAQAWDAGKLFHIDLNDQAFGRYDQDFRFGASNPKTAFFLVKFLEDVGYAESRHFDAHAYRTEDYEGVKDFARGCMRTYLILREKARRWNADAEIQAIVRDLNADPDGMAGKYLGAYSPEKAQALAAASFDRTALGATRAGVRAARPAHQRSAVRRALGADAERGYGHGERFPALFGIDVSTTGAKALLIDSGGQVVASATTPLTLSTPRRSGPSRRRRTGTLASPTASARRCGRRDARAQTWRRSG